MAKAEQHTAAAWTELNLSSLLDTQEADEAIAAFRELVYAASRQARRLAGSRDQTDERIAVRSPDARSYVIARFANALDQARFTDSRNHDRDSQVFPASAPGIHLKEAAIAINAATDLLATHKTTEGNWRAPESVALDDLSERLTSLAQLAGITTVLGDVRKWLLREQALTGRVSGRNLKRSGIPDLAAIRDAARELRALVSSRENGSRIAAATVANPDIRTEDPLLEISDRVARIRLAAWHAATYPTQNNGGIAALIHFATAGVLVHGYGSKATAWLTKVDIRDPDAPATVKSFTARADAWRRVRSRLHELASPGSPDPTLPEDVNAIRTLLAALTRQARPLQAAADIGSQREITEPQTHLTEDLTRLTVILTESTEAFEQISSWNTTTIINSDPARLYLPGRLLTRQECVADPDRASAKLQRTFALAPPGRVQDIVGAYYETQAYLPFSDLTPLERTMRHPGIGDGPGL